MKFKKGDAVECLIFGKGEVVHINISNYSVSVKLDKHGTTNIYTADGRYTKKANITLTKGRWEIKEILPEDPYDSLRSYILNLSFFIPCRYRNR